MARATWFCIDIEASGPVPALYDMVSLGAVVVYDDDAQDISIGERFYMELKPQAPRMDAHAMSIHGLSAEHLHAEGLPRGVAMKKLDAWVRDRTAPGTEAVFVGHNAPFDWSYVAWCFQAEDMPNPFGYKALDTKALAGGVLGLHWLDTNKERLSALLDLPAEDMGKKHRADYDAWFQALILKGLLERQRSQQA
ncbi:MAG: 3'-5' exonuclease [Alphaproteobacteria bacterium]|nr:3'-5' exonuclease [Alphaproteobacteria bacterium]MCB9791250.1 3'-5' exonuclease [Alphaproteobacteria bacterium]